MEAEIEKLRAENKEIKDRNSKLRAIEKELQTRVQKGAKENKFAHVRGKLSKSSTSEGDRKMTEFIDKLKVKLVANEK